MNTFRRFICLTKRNVMKFNKFLSNTSLMTWSIPLSVFLFMLLPCTAVSQQDTSRQAMIDRFQKLLSNSNTIVDAQVISKEGKWDHTQDWRGIYTSIKFKVFQTIKGNVEGNEFTFDQPGGTAEGVTTIVTTSAPYDLHERAIYFFKNKKLTGYLHQNAKYPIRYGKLFVEDESIEADLFVKVLKKSLTDESVIPRFVDMIRAIKEGQELRKKGSNKILLIPDPLANYKFSDTKPKIIRRSKESIKDTIKQENNNTIKGGVK